MFTLNIGFDINFLSLEVFFGIICFNLISFDTI